MRMKDRAVLVRAPAAASARPPRSPGSRGRAGIRVNVVAPGLTLTDATAWQPQEAKEAAARRTPLRRNGQPEDVAAAVLALASDDARFMTGAHLPVSGGVQML